MNNQTGFNVWERMLGDEGEQQEEDCYTTEMRMLRGILGVLRGDHMRNNEIRRILHLVPVDEVMCSGRLRWFGQVQTRDENTVTCRVVDLAIPGTRRRGRPKKTWHQQVNEDMTGVGITHADKDLDRKEWRRRTRPTPIGDWGKGLQGEQVEQKFDSLTIGQKPASCASALNHARS